MLPDRILSRLAELDGTPPLAIADALRAMPGLAVLESARPGRTARWSFVTADPLAIVGEPGPPGQALEPARRALARLAGPGPWAEPAEPAEPAEAAKPTDLIAAAAASGLMAAEGEGARNPGAAGVGPAAAPAAGPPFTGGLVGYLAYDLGRHLERLPPDRRPPGPLPVLRLALHDWVVALDGRTGDVWLAGRAVDGDRARLGRRLAAVRDRLASVGRSSAPEPLASVGRSSAPEPLASSGRSSAPEPLASVGPSAATDVSPFAFAAEMDRAGWLARVAAVREAIAAGELYQANLARRVSAPFGADPWPLFRRLRSGEPAGFSAYLDLGPDEAGHARALCSASPEPFLALDGTGRVRADPIKGTRPRGATRAEDRDLAADLLASGKDRAENTMIVDVLRHDLGRVCRPGSVRVPRLWRLERTASVQHLVSTVSGSLAPGRDALDLLAAAFPGGSVTGAPKLRAMELIDALEPVVRGPYCGSALWLDAGGAMGSSILIRTFVADGTRLSLHVGGGITWRSDAAAEWEETVTKARGPLRAIGGTIEREEVG